MKTLQESIIGRKGETFTGKPSLREYDIVILKIYRPEPQPYFVIFDEEIIKFMVGQFEKDPMVISDRMELAKEGLLVCGGGYEYLSDYKDNLTSGGDRVVTEVYRSHNHNIFRDIKNMILSKYFVPIKWINKIWRTQYNKIWERK